MIREILPGLFQARGALVSHYALVDAGEACVIDGGFANGLALTEEALRLSGLGWESVSTILLTHGHLDHTLNVAAMAALSGASVYCHRSDADHVAGSFAYRRASRVCGWLEAAGRRAFKYEKPRIDTFIEDGDTLDVWGGLRVVHCPGHTAGHCGFVSERTGIFFAGDLLASARFGAIKPWPWLNSCAAKFEESYAKVGRLELRGMLCNHCDNAGPAKQLERFRRRFDQRD